MDVQKARSVRVKLRELRERLVKIRPRLRGDPSDVAVLDALIADLDQLCTESERQVGFADASKVLTALGRIAELILHLFTCG